MKLTNPLYETEHEIHSKLASLHEQNKTNEVLYQQEKVASNLLRNVLQQKTSEWNRKEKGKFSQKTNCLIQIAKEFEEELDRIREENQKLKSNISDFEENEERWKVKSNAIEAAQSARVQAEEDLKAQNTIYEQEKKVHLLEIQGYQSRNSELNSIISIMKEENEALQQKNIDLVRKLHDLELNLTQLQTTNKIDQADLTNEIRKKIVLIKLN